MFRKRIRDLGARPRRLLTAGCAAERLEGRVLLDAVPVGPQFFANDQRPGKQMYPAVAADDAGNFVVVWDDQGEISARRFTAAGNALGAQFHVGDGRLPRVAMDADGDFVVAWETPYLSVEAARYSRSGVRASLGRVPTTENHGPDREPDVAMSRSGEFVISWTSAWTPDDGTLTSPHTRIFARRYDAGGRAKGTDFQVSVEEGVADFPDRSSVAMDDAGDFVVAWTHIVPGPWAVLTRRYAASAAPLADPVAAARGLFRPVAPAVAMDADGDFVVAYADYDNNLSWRRYDRALDLWGPQNAVSPGRDSGGYRPAVAMDADGDFCIATLGGYDYEPVLSAQWYSAGGVKVGEQLRVSTGDPTNIEAASVAVDEHGGFTVAWQEFGFQTGSWDVMGRRYVGGTTSTPAVTGVFVSGSAWDARFAAALEQRGLGHDEFGFAVPLSGPPNPLPWLNVDRITLSFRQDVVVRQDDLAVRGVAVPSYAVSEFVYNADTRTATWTLARPVPADRVSLELGGAAAGSAGFRAAFNVLPGDVNRDGRVNAIDLVRTRARRGAVPDAPGAPADAVFHDLDGSNSVNTIDALWVRLNQARVLPPPAPASAVAGGPARRGAPATRTLLTSR